MIKLTEIGWNMWHIPAKSSLSHPIPAYIWTPILQSPIPNLQFGMPNCAFYLQLDICMLVLYCSGQKSHMYLLYINPAPHLLARTSIGLNMLTKITWKLKTLGGILVFRVLVQAWYKQCSGKSVGVVWKNLPYGMPKSHQVFPRGGAPRESLMTKVKSSGQIFQTIPEDFHCVSDFRIKTLKIMRPRLDPRVNTQWSLTVLSPDFTGVIRKSAQSVWTIAAIPKISKSP